MKRFYWQILICLLLLFDQLSKYWAMSNSQQILNSGVSFGLGGETGVLPLVASGILLICLGWYWVHSGRSNALLLIMAGGVSNLLDRIWYGAVIDWMGIPGTELRNNCADYMIAVGVLWLVAQVIIDQVSVKKNS